jgi:TonB family protein
MTDWQRGEPPQIPRVEEVGTLPRGAVIGAAIAGGVVFIALAVAGLVLFVGTHAAPTSAPTTPKPIALPLAPAPPEPPKGDAPGPALALPAEAPSSDSKPLTLATRFTGKAIVRAGAQTVSGRLPTDVVQRVVRQRFGRFRMCYEQALARDKTLRGRLSVRFVVGRDGSVSNVSIADSELGNPLQSCVASAFAGATFPAPEGGIVTVVYPLIFETEPNAR